MQQRRALGSAADSDESLVLAVLSHERFPSLVGGPAGRLSSGPTLPSRPPPDARPRDLPHWFDFGMKLV